VRASAMQALLLLGPSCLPQGCHAHVFVKNVYDALVLHSCRKKVSNWVRPWRFHARRAPTKPNLVRRGKQWLF